VSGDGGKNDLGTASSAGAAATPKQPSSTGSEETKTRKRTPRTTSPSDNGGNVEQFTRSDIDDLLRRARNYEGNGDYVQAKYTYGIVLRLDKKNATARAGLDRIVQAAK
jgi:hypothetical protein